MIEIMFKIGQMANDPQSLALMQTMTGLGAPVMSPAAMASYSPLLMQAQTQSMVNPALVAAVNPEMVGTPGIVPPVNFAEELASIFDQQSSADTGQEEQESPPSLVNKSAPTLWQGPGPVDYQNVMLGQVNNPAQYVDYGLGGTAF
jgi:hypothetical protein